jgi:hypothetical protein
VHKANCEQELEDPVNYEVFAEMFAVFATLLDVPFEIAF